jgi:hypothetical protein
VAADAIANGTERWVSDTPGDPRIDAKVDIGTLRAAGDAIEALVRWPSAPGAMRAWRSMHPELALPEGTVAIDRERILCRRNGAVAYLVERWLVTPDGREHGREKFDPEERRAEAEKLDAEQRARLPEYTQSYRPDSASLVCLAAASKCNRTPLAWPPPPNRAPLENSQRADDLRSAYNAAFVPGCKL